MSIKTLRSYQERAVESGLAVFSQNRSLLDAAGEDASGRATAITHNGYLLIEAPTGAGKTLMAGTLVERFSREDAVVWFWFAPFKGVTGQTADSLRGQFKGLRLRELADDRSAEGSKGGDVFVTTWQSVATRVKDSRSVRKEGDTNPSIDTLVDSLRSQGLRVGVVVDEAHHGFGQGTQAAKFFHEVLMPEYTILITATPDDKEIKAFEKTLGIAELHRIRVSRRDCVDEGLIKQGVKCAAYFVDPAKRALVDLEGTALRDGVAAHRKLKQLLSEGPKPLVPLMLVQAGDGKKDDPKVLKERLLSLGFTEDQIAIHTAAEPDPDLLALANDEKREVLIFKMAVALGFDAPRAFTLVSMRASRDADFGVQLVGRILRVHAHLQTRARAKALPEVLNHGYVFLADAESQIGLDLAGQKINQIQTEYAKVSHATVALRFGEGVSRVARVAPSGQVEFGLEIETTGGGVGGTGEEISGMGMDGGGSVPVDFDFASFFGGNGEDEDRKSDVGSGKSRPASVAGAVKTYRYPLRADVPRRFKTQTAGSNNEVTEEDCARRFIVSTRELFEVMKNRVPVERRTLDVFTREVQQEFNYAADLSPDQAARQAQRILLENKVLDPRELRRALLRKMELVMRDEAMSEVDDPDKVAHFLNVILATRPELLRKAQKEAIARHAEIIETEELLPEITSDTPLAQSPRNIYQVRPGDLNGWESDFADLLDRDSGGHVLWWHRNEPRKPSSVNVLMPDGRGFYPDFIIGIDGRKTEEHVLLADPKLNFAREDEAPKVLAEHGTYGRVLILAKDGAARWMTVEYDGKRGVPFAAREFRLADAAGF
ncbi:MAG: DEAD/DEAH box helicase family protein [Luteolibacter sp.]